MKIWVGVTDRDWFDHLSSRSPDEVNFGSPAATGSFGCWNQASYSYSSCIAPTISLLEEATCALFSAACITRLGCVWREKWGGVLSGAPDRVRRYRRADNAVDPVIGCNVLATPFFLPISHWIPVPKSWAPNIVQGKSYDTSTTEGTLLWQTVRDAVPSQVGGRDSGAEPMELNVERLVPNI